jgi:DNA-binding winged helix-turn-helix (wHTH) protein
MAASVLYTFGPFELDARTRRLTRSGEYVAIGDRHLGVLLELVASAGHVVSKESIIDAVWGEIAVTDNSLEQVVSGLRKLLGDDRDGRPYLETVPRRGYRFASTIARTVSRETDEAMTFAVVPAKSGVRVSVLTGFTLRRR